MTVKNLITRLYHKHIKGYMNISWATDPHLFYTDCMIYIDNLYSGWAEFIELMLPYLYSEAFERAYGWFISAVGLNRNTPEGRYIKHNLFILQFFLYNYMYIFIIKTKTQ